MRFCNFHMRALTHDWPLLKKEIIVNIIACAIASTWLDYCNSMRYRISNYMIKRQQPYKFKCRAIQIIRMKPSTVVSLLLDPRAHRLHERYYYTQGTVSSQGKLFVHLIVEYIPSRLL